MALMGGRKVWECGVGGMREEVGLERRERGVQPWRKGVESLRDCREGSWRSEGVRGIELDQRLEGDKEPKV